jgi:hypothetical protein
MLVVTMGGRPRLRRNIQVQNFGFDGADHLSTSSEFASATPSDYASGTDLSDVELSSTYSLTPICEL